MAPESGKNSKAATRWQIICNGKSKFWYTRSCLRCLAIMSAIAALISFGVIWPQVVKAERDTYFGGGSLGFAGFEIAAALVSLIINISASAQLFLIRKGRFINPAWLLSGDIIAILCFVFSLLLNSSAFWFWVGDNGHWTPIHKLVIPWGFSIATALFHIVTMSVGAWEVDVYRHFQREGGFAPETQELAVIDDGTKNVEQS